MSHSCSQPRGHIHVHSKTRDSTVQFLVINRVKVQSLPPSAVVHTVLVNFQGNNDLEVGVSQRTWNSVQPIMFFVWRNTVTTLKSLLAAAWNSVSNIIFRRNTGHLEVQRTWNSVQPFVWRNTDNLWSLLSQPHETVLVIYFSGATEPPWSWSLLVSS